MWRRLGRCASVVLLALSTTAGGCLDRPSSEGHPDLVWGRIGLSDGRLFKPRAMTIDRTDQLYIADMTGRVQVFSPDGKFLRGWRTPEIANGKPCGLKIDRDGNLLVADTHYFRVLVYTPMGELLKDRIIGGECGTEPGQFSFVTDAVQDSRGNYFIAEYGDCDRVQKFSREGRFLMQWGGHGDHPGEFSQPRGLEIDEQDNIWVADACNHRIQVFEGKGDHAKLLRIWGEQGTRPGQLRYPYGLALDGKGHVYVAEFGNCRVQKFTVEGRYLAHWGSPGRREGELNQPWDVVLDSRGRVYILDTYNHRVQRIRL